MVSVALLRAGRWVRLAEEPHSQQEHEGVLFHHGVLLAPSHIPAPSPRTRAQCKAVCSNEVWY